VKGTFTTSRTSNRTMKTLLFLLTLLFCCHWSPAQTDAGLLGAGDWSEPVNDGDGHTLRGRLLVYDENAPSAANHARVYLELEHVFKGGWTNPIEIYFDIAGDGLDLKVRDANDKIVPQTPMVIRGPRVAPCWITMPCDSTVRLRADLYNLGPTSKPNGLEILVGGGGWIIPSSADREFFLSGTFTPPADHSSALKYHVWQGTLNLPKVKISARKPG
jgi:hypothetical protein